MKNTNIYFSDESNGYNKEQVNNYIDNLSKAYEIMYGEHQSLIKKYNELSDDMNKLNAQERPDLNSDVIAKTLVRAETLAQNIVADAHTEAAYMIASAKTDSKKIMDDAYTEKTSIMAQAEKIFENVKADLMKIINDANNSLQAIQMEKYY